MQAAADLVAAQRAFQHADTFLGGLFERSEEDGKTGGRIFFFPYGNRPGKD